MSEDRGLETLVLEMRLLEGYFNEVTTRQNAVARAVIDGRVALETIRSLPREGVSEILVPIGGGIFMRTDLPLADRFIVSLGADVAMEKSRETAILFLEERTKELENAMTALEGQKREIANRMNQSRAELGALVGRQSG